MVPEISSATYNFLCHFRLFFALLPPNNPEIKILKKWKTLGDIIFLHISTMNQNHMVYDSWDTERNRQNFFSFWTIFCPSIPPPLTTKRTKILKKWKKDPRDIIILHKCTINDNHMICGSWDINCNRQIFFLTLGHFLPFYPLPP